MANETQRTSRRFVRRVFSIENLTGDVRSALIGAGTGSVITVVGGLIAAALIAKPLSYTVFLNEDGFGQPRALFDLAEKSNPRLKLEFTPSDLRSVYVCEYKHVTGPNYTEMVIKYLENYKDCFDVSATGENDLKIFANKRSARLQQSQGIFLCQCTHTSNK